jgi:hypothetical protein
VNLAAVYSRQIDGRSLTIAPSGWTYADTFVLYDRETGSIWYPYENELRAIQGPYFGRRLPMLPSEDTSWRLWSKNHPDSKLLR